MPSPSSTSPAILVAGGAGYIGSHTSKELQKAGFTPVVLDNLVTGNRFAQGRFGPFYEGSISDAALVSEIVRKHSIAGAILFAGYAYVGESTQWPRKYFNNNVSSAIAFTDALLDAGVNKVVFSSSCSIYGTQEKVPIGEDAPKNPLSPYAETKLFFERVLRAYDSAYSLRSVCLRYFNAAGADPEGEIGENHDPETHLIPLTIYAAMGKGPLNVFGSDYPTPDGTAIRDYIHVTDLGDAHIRGLRYLLDGHASVQLNCGTGQGNSVKEVIAMVEAVSGRKVPVEFGPRREGDAPALVADASEAKRMLGWNPQVSSLESIVRTAWRWHSELAPAVLKTP